MPLINPVHPTLAACAVGFCLLAICAHLTSIAIAARRCRRRRWPLACPTDAPPVSLVRPVCGLDNFAEETLGSSFRLDYPRYEILFCVARADDPAVPLVQRLIAASPAVPARLLIGDDRPSINPKLNNVVKGWDAARYDWIILADSNVLMPADYVQRLRARWSAETGLVCSVPIASRPRNFWAELECAFLNTYEARWEYGADTLGFGFAQGKSMLWRRDIVERGGGIRALGAEIAEDAAATKLVRAAGRKVQLVDAPFEQPLGRRSAREVWLRQVRWARLRRMTFPVMFLPELLVGCVFPALAAAFAAQQHGIGAVPAVAALLVLWFGTELALARTAGWHVSARLPFALLLRDLLLPALFVAAWMGSGFTWRGTVMTRRSGGADLAPAELAGGGGGTPISRGRWPS
ncbi:MAG: ceramide glucosyltransferase [Stellaceae bacterium]